ncbi:putative defense protein 2 [Lycorma delicatula]|uniref:putative defense protein 2 n=1 Tax=Lycorma delicatula TaxID=130591 RepID=UPI003F516F2A
MKLAIDTGLLLFVFVSYANAKPFPQTLELITASHKASFHDLSQACETLTPVHSHHQPQTSPSPYTITLSKTLVEPSDKIEIRITGKSGIQFKGFMVQARSGDKIINGRFERTNNIGLIDCFDGKENTATNAVHPDRIDKDEVKLIWFAPTNLKDDFNFVVTVVKDFSTFWIGQKSDTIKVKSTE